MLTLGFDARNDTPAHMAKFAVTQGVNFDNWRLASADAVTLSALLRDLGFSYAAVAGGFDHVTQTTILDRDFGSLPVSVTVSKGVVKLSGALDNTAQIAQIAAAVNQVKAGA